MSASFGLSADPGVQGNYLVNSVLEPTFILIYYLGFSFQEAMNLPLGWRRWFIDRLQRELNKTGDNGETLPNKSAEHNTREMRAMMGMGRDAVPAKLRRFT